MTEYNVKVFHGKRGSECIKWKVKAKDEREALLKSIDKAAKMNLENASFEIR